MRIAIFLLLALSYQSLFAQAPEEDGSDSVDDRPRIINTTDLGADPDDRQSLVRFLVMSNRYDVEGLIVSTGCWRKSQSNTSMLDEIVDAYGEVLPNLQVHADGYPSYEYLQSISVMGQRGYGMSNVGERWDSPGSELIIAAVDEDDPRPVWATCWGGCNTIAQALWKVQNTRSEEEVAEFVSKLRVYDVLGQDNAGTWIAKTFPDLLYIRATGVYGWAPSDGWIDENVQGHGPLGAEYPDRRYATEGDTPAFLHVYPNGLHDPDLVEHGGWGGRFDQAKQQGIRGMSCMEGEDAEYDPYFMHGNTSEGAGAISRWRPAYDNDFAARMDWSITSDYGEANHHPFAVVNGDTTRQVLRISAAPGSSVTLSAEGSGDPDGDALVYSWSFYSEPSTYLGRSVDIQGRSSETATVSVPSDADGDTIHVILELHDTGSPNLYAYRRVIIDVLEPGSPPVLFEGESGELGEEWETVTDEETGATYVAITSDYDETTGSGDYPGANRTASYEVVFPQAGEYRFFARVSVGAGGCDDDSFFAPDSFGVMQPAEVGDWRPVNGLCAAGFTDPEEYVEEAGAAAADVWKWVNLSENGYHAAPTGTYLVEEGDLTQTFEIGARENGLAIDKFAFGPTGVYYTVSNLDNGEPGVTELPGDTIPEPTGPPLAEGLDKWLGNVYDTDTEHFEHYWNQVTPENAGKWGSVEGTRDEMSWSSLDEAYDLAQDNDFPFRFHVLVWGEQQPGWINDLEPAEQLEEIREWMEAVAARYPDIDYLEVVNEPLPGHNPPDGVSGTYDYIEALGGARETGWDWVITAFEMAREIFPEETQLVINDYGILGDMNATRQYRDIVELLQERDLIDAIGMQGHAFSTRGSASDMQDELDHLAETGLPLMITEVDIDGNPNTTDITQQESDQNQLEAMQRIFPALWEHEAVVGITFWGWRSPLWRQEQEAYLLHDNGEERPAMTWLREYLDEYRALPAAPTAEAPASFRLSGNYPNPFKPSTQIRYDIAAPVDVTLRVFDILGREVATLVDARQVPGEHTVTFDANGLSTGVYLYRLQAGSFVATERMVLVK